MTYYSPNTVSTAPVRQSISLPPVRLQAQRMLSDDEEHDSVEALAHHLAVQCISCLTSYVRDKNPLVAKKFSSVIWLRATGDIELVRETNYLKQIHEELVVTDSLFVEAFFSKNDASPFCSFYEGWVPDPKGEFVGDMKGRQHCIKSAWDSENSIARTDSFKAALSAIEWTRLRIEPAPQVVVINTIRKCVYREKLKGRILRWILLGNYVPVLENISLFGLKRAVNDYGIDFITRCGTDRFYRAIKEKTQHAIAQQATY